MIATRGRSAWTSTSRVRDRLAVMRHDEQIDGADAVGRAHQVEFLVPGQVAEVRHAEPAERDDAADRLRVLGRIRILRLVAGAVRIGRCRRRAAAS